MNSSAEGVSKIAKSEHWLTTAVWSIFLIITSVTCLMLIIENLTEYFSFPVTTKIRQKSEQASLFPVIGFCNTNPFTTSYAIEYLANLINLTFPNETNGTSVMDDVDLLYRLYIKHKYRIHTLLHFNTNSTIQRRLGLSLEDTLMHCEFQQMPCDTSAFRWFFHFRFDNCYLFDTSQRVFTAGRDGALTLELFVGSEKVTPMLSYATGLELMILNQSEHEHFSYFFESYRVKPNTDTTFSIKRNFVNKLPYPYSSCTLDLRTNSRDSIDSDLYREFFDRNVTYNRFYCLRQAYRSAVYKQCNCVTELGDFQGVTNICEGAKEIACDNEIFNDLERNGFNGTFDNDCPLECNRMYFDIITDMQNFPSKMHARQLMGVHGYFRRQNLTRVEDVKESVLRVNVYYRDIGYTSLEEIATYYFKDMIGSTGGMLGLFLGISLISFVEIVELFIDVIQA